MHGGGAGAWRRSGREASLGAREETRDNEPRDNEPQNGELAMPSDGWFDALVVPPPEWFEPPPDDRDGVPSEAGPVADAGAVAGVATPAETPAETRDESPIETDARDDTEPVRPLLGAAELDALFERPVRPRIRMGVGAAIVLALVALAIALVVAALQPAPVTTLSGAQDGGASAPASSGTPALPGDALGASAVPAEPGTSGSTSMLVHVVGAVAAPGVYSLGAGSRAIDAINAAGGFADDADRGAVNLARSVADGEQLYVPRVGETPPPAPDVGAGQAVGSGGGTTGGSPGLVNLNTASSAELETLPRIGPAIAGRIIDYRQQNGGFSSVDELRNVSGIGDATFEALAPLVTV